MRASALLLWKKSVRKLEEKLAETDMEGEGSRRASFYAKDIRKQSLWYLYLTFKNKKEKKKKNLSLFA